MNWVISGIQQIGIGCKDAEASFKWYRQNFGMNVPVFKDAARANLMTRYTSGKAEDRYAILAMNMQGGGGMEIWQYTSKVSVDQPFKPVLGDTGIYAAKMKALRIHDAFKHFQSNGYVVSKEVRKTPDGALSFFTRDPDGNLFQVIESKDWFKSKGHFTGGVTGAIIGVSSIDKSIELYKTILGATDVIYDVTDDAPDFSELKTTNGKVRRALLAVKQTGLGAFGRLLGKAYVELVEVQGYTPRKIYEGRNWGDMGFIHLCFDVRDMKALGAGVEKVGHKFTVDSADSFDMGKAAGHFTYVEDRDGTLIEFVETHKVPVLAKLGLYLNLRNRDPKKPLPDWMVGLMGLNKVTD
ncbi:MAG TPA: VOC family protein [Cyclobacteriaceae bacterium]|nr:VOC family protein [Cyclobacteriaceae bacterium]